MQAVHGEAAAYFNLGYLLQKKGQTQQAIQAFSTALRFDPNMVQAQQWIERLSNPTMAAAPSGPTSVPAAAPYGAAAPPGPYGVRPTGPYAGNVAMPPGPPRYAAPTTVPPPPASAWPPAAPMQPMPPMQPTHAPPYAIEPTVLPPPAAPSSAAPGVAAPPAMTPPAAAPNIYSEPSAATPPALSAPQNGPNAGLRLSNRRPSPTAETAPLPPAMPDSLQRLPTVR
jgi:hypothetical protein